MIIGETFWLKSVAIGVFLMFSSQNTDAYAFLGSNRGIQLCLQDDDCDQTELCSIDTKYSKTVKRCMKNCEYSYGFDIDCVNPDPNNPIECHRDSDCADGKVCQKQKHKCIDACERLSCGRNSFCKVVYERQVACRCLNGYSGNPYKKEGCKRKY